MSTRVFHCIIIELDRFFPFVDSDDREAERAVHRTGGLRQWQDAHEFERDTFHAALQPRL